MHYSTGYSLELEDGRLLLRAPTNAGPLIKQIPGGRWDKNITAWELPLSWASCVAVRGVLGTALETGPAIRDWARSELATRINPALAARVALDAAGPAELYAYQRACVEFLRITGSALVADQMGLGKCVETIFALEADGSYPALIVCPNSVKAVWEQEFAKWAPHRVVKVAGSGEKTAEAAVQEVANGAGDVLVINWEALRYLSRLAPYGSIRLQPCSQCDPTSKRRPSLCHQHDKVLNLIQWAAVVADEAHRAKDPKSEQTRALWAVGDRAGRRIALTGTPIANDVGELWPVMRFVAPTEYPVRTAWNDRYALMMPNFHSGFNEPAGFKPETRAEFDKIFLPRFIRRTKAEVLKFLPPKVYERRDVTLTGKQKTAYDSMAKEMVAAIQGGTLIAANVLTASLRLRQFASAYGVLLDTGSAGDHDQMAVVDQQVRLEEPSSKLDVLEEVLEELGERQAVIFAESSQLIDLAAARVGDRGVRITGAVSAPDRARHVQLFQEGKVQYILVTTGAGGEGITLTAADTAIFLQRPWSAVANAQAEDRLHRIGQTAQSVTYIDLVTAGTIEEKVFTALRKKEAALQQVVRDDDP